MYDTYFMFTASGRRYLIKKEDIVHIYPVRALKCDCLITRNGRQYNATNITEINAENIDGET